MIMTMLMRTTTKRIGSLVVKVRKGVGLEVDMMMIIISNMKKRIMVIIVPMATMIVMMMKQKSSCKYTLV